MKRKIISSPSPQQQQCKRSKETPILDHNIDDDNDDELLVTIILDDDYKHDHDLMLGLQKQLGGNKIKILQLDSYNVEPPSVLYNKDEEEDDIVVEDDDDEPKLIQYITKSLSKNLIIIIDGDNRCYTFNLETKTWKFEFKCPYFQTVYIDTQFEYIYITNDSFIKKYKISKKIKDKYLIWMSDSPSRECIQSFCESKNELYTMNKFGHSNNITVFNSLNGIENGKPIKLKELYGFNTDRLFYDEKDETFYILYKLITNDDNNSDSDDDFNYDSDDDNTENYHLYIKNEKRGIFKHVGTFSSSLINILFFEKCFICITIDGHKYLYEKKSNNLLRMYRSKGDFGNANYFDSTNDLFYYISAPYDIITFNDDVGKTIGCEKFKLTMQIKNVPLKRQAYQHLSKLGAKFPTLLSQVAAEMKPDCIEYLLNIDFGSKLIWYINNDFKKYFKFINTSNVEKFYNNKRDFNLIGGLLTINSETRKYDDLRICVKGQDVPSRNICDFPIYFLLNVKEEIHNVLFSEFIKKLKVSDSIEMNHCIYLINFEIIYEELIKKSMIDSKSKLIDNNLLLEKYKKMVCGENKHDYFAIAKKYNDSKILIDNTSFLKMDLIALAIDCYSGNGFLKLSHNEFTDL